MRRVGGRKVTAQYPGRSGSLSERTSSAERRCDGQPEVSRGHSSPANHGRRPEHEETEKTEASMRPEEPLKRAEMQERAGW